MIYSMTGFGRTEKNIGNKQVIVELKSLNGKQFDLNARFPSLLNPFEMLIRKRLQEMLKRGSVQLNISVMQNGMAKPVAINQEVVKIYYSSIQQITKDLSLDWEKEQQNILSTILQMPEVVSPENESLSDEEWKEIDLLIQEAADLLIQFREKEGAAIEQDLLSRVGQIRALLNEVGQYEQERIQRIKNRIEDNLETIIGKDKWDANRLEQELIYYIEKIDISEEKQRLAAHCKYFKELTSEADVEGVGKKLGFVLQEIGREINTLGSKANDVDLQKIVIQMKDELEKAKEQVLNIL